MFSIVFGWSQNGGGDGTVKLGSKICSKKQLLIGTEITAACMVTNTCFLLCFLFDEDCEITVRNTVRGVVEGVLLSPFFFFKIRAA